MDADAAVDSAATAAYGSSFFSAAVAADSAADAAAMAAATTADVDAANYLFEFLKPGPAVKHRWLWLFYFSSLFFSFSSL